MYNTPCDNPFGVSLHPPPLHFPKLCYVPVTGIDFIYIFFIIYIFIRFFLLDEVMMVVGQQFHLLHDFFSPQIAQKEGSSFITNKGRKIYRTNCL